jgi:nucleotide-binding universal stress UspA family protein
MMEDGHTLEKKGDAGGAAAQPNAVANRWSVRRILVPIDYSDNSRLALRYAAPLARHFGATITLIHVDAVTWRDADMQNIPLVLSPQEAAERTVNDLMRIGREELRWAFAGDFKGTAVTRRGEAAEEIAAAAVELGIDLIVMSTHGHGGFRRKLMGGVAERVIHAAPCPVCTFQENVALRHPAHESGGPGWNNIVVPVDFSECSRRATRLAAAVAAATGGRLTLFNVVNLSETRLVHPLLSFKVTQAKRRAEALAQLAQWAEKEVGTGIPVTPIVRVGIPSAALLVRGLQWLKSDLVVMGTHDYSWWKRLMEGGTTGELVRHAPCAVLSLREALDLHFDEPTEPC